ncbi:hypothetical protein ODZ83_02800 [Acaricomes phytoseiuli]|nr:hypothetical protein [Acaricomes phytoseiuli]MCW1249128.1 hypothetical protein [Acaricomes phytoseiuli]
MTRRTSVSPQPAVLCRFDQLPARGRVLCRGYVESITFQPVNAPPEFSAILSEASDADSEAPAHRAGKLRLRLVWLGQRAVPGIATGTTLRFQGMLLQRDGLPTVFNPRYEIISHTEPQRRSGNRR